MIVRKKVKMNCSEMRSHLLWRLWLNVLAFRTSLWSEDNFHSYNNHYCKH